ncbi:hypothetical protein ACRE_003190 [Hapsidospora chrysogenum ATCC 11550]|uniref:N-acetyltransferase domain-containing protein n=1 Tax=Hapsidospora chrysogenum (strain ATCC 11550 / CBS 779.69 / DSM 880 / IAM 14645 / JCM 23072 / IMI 49137) TaxID=857340 RepID=A0A086THH2_HAPC1|nr:hypothetical protein ACRE_003190 [Hapsidospora chrysogenum ATCC 11550]
MEACQPSKPSWRRLAESDIDSLMSVAEQVHPDLPESAHVFTERIKLFPQGCLALVDEHDRLCGYAISHPIRKGQPPALDTLLEELPSDEQEQQYYYIHDVAILSRVRGRGLAAECVKQLLEAAKSYEITCLISVYGTESFWSRFGFVPGPVGDRTAEKLRVYGEDAKYLVRSNRQ